MSLFQTEKPKSAGKIMVSDSEQLQNVVLDTLNHMADMAGATLGPGGRQVLIERPEMGMKPIMTKDGVTVIKNLGYTNPLKQLILESARDAALRTASEAGDGPQPLYSKVLTPKGFIPMGEVRVGMEICGTDGTIQTVLGVFPKGEKEIYEVEFSNGSIVECCADHLWSVSDVQATSPKTKVQIKTTKSMEKDYVRMTPDGYPTRRYYTPRTFVEFYTNEAEMPLDPYLVGVLLGDGSLGGTGSVELSMGSKKEHIISKLVLPDGLYLHTTFVENKNAFRVKIQGTDKNGRSIADHVKSIGLYGSLSGSKFIPKSYLYSSVANRTKLLQGLLDTDGHINTRDRFEFSTISAEMASDFKELCYSLGKSTCNTTLERKEGSSYSMTPIHRITELKGYLRGNSIVRITPTGKSTEMQCIKVSNENSLYITDGYITTHNTTSSMILAASVASSAAKFSTDLKEKISPQRIVRELQAIVPEIKKEIDKYSVLADEDNYSEVLLSVASLSANGDKELADKVLESFDLVGEEGNLTIVEATGPSSYMVERIAGYTIDQGYEESLKRFSNGFINDRSGTMIGMENPVVILYDGAVSDLTQIFDGLQKLSDYWDKTNHAFRNVLIVAHGFSDLVLGDLHTNWNHPKTMNILPLLTPETAIRNWRTQFLYDLQAYTGSTVFNPLDAPIVDLDPKAMTEYNLVKNVECGRFRTSIISTEDPDLIQPRVDELKEQLKTPESQYEQNDLNVRIGKLTSGIARLYVYGPSQGETREKRDRAEDAWMAIRGAAKHGAVPGGGFVLVKVSDFCQKRAAKTKGAAQIAYAILGEALLKPVERLYLNYGYTKTESVYFINKLLESTTATFDVAEQKWVPFTALLDSTPAVTQAIENSISIASLLGTLGGIISFDRNKESDRREQVLERDFVKGIGGE
jgi:chaperonin GroEL (HSP60 family)